MNAQQEKVDRALKRKGFGGLTDPRLVQQLAFCVRDHVHLRTVLVGIKPEERTKAFDQMRPYLRFKAKPLDVYIAEAAELAANREYDQTAIDILAEKAIEQTRHEQKHGELELVCTKCTTFEIFRAAVKQDAEKAAHSAGWRSDLRKTYCPGHVPTRGTIKVNCVNEDCHALARLRCWDPQDGYTELRRLGWTIDDAAVCPTCTLRRAVVLQ